MQENSSTRFQLSFCMFPFKFVMCMFWLVLDFMWGHYVLSALLLINASVIPFPGKRKTYTRPHFFNIIILDRFHTFLKQYVLYKLTIQCWAPSMFLWLDLVRPLWPDPTRGSIFLTRLRSNMSPALTGPVRPDPSHELRLGCLNAKVRSMW